MSFRHIISVLIIYCSAVFAAAQPYCDVSVYGAGSGAVIRHSTEIVQDKTGMIWIAAWNGLFRFDGNEFVCFKTRPGDACTMPSDRIRNICLDEEGNIHCALDDNQRYVFNVRTHTFQKDVKDITFRRKTYYIAKHKKYSFTDQHGTQWTLYSNGKIEYLDEKKGEYVLYPLTPMPERLKFCFRDSQDNVWATNDESVYKLSFGIVPTETYGETEGQNIRGIMVDRKKRCWTADKTTKTVTIYDEAGQRIGSLTPDGRLAEGTAVFGAPVYCIYETSDGSVWLGSKPDGLFRLRETEKGGFDIEKVQGLNDTSIYDIREDSRHRLWIATYDGGINCIENIYSKTYNVTNVTNRLIHYPPTCRKVRNIHITSRNVLFAATTEGLLVADISKKNTGDIVFRRHTRNPQDKESLSCNSTIYVTEDSKGRVFVCTESGGVCRVEDRDMTAEKLHFTNYGTDNILPTDVILSARKYHGDILLVSSNSIIILNADERICMTFDKRTLRRKCAFSEAPCVVLPSGDILFPTEEGAFTINPSRLAKSGFNPTIAFVAASIENLPERYDVTALDTLVLESHERNVSLRFASLDYIPGNIFYAFRFTKDSESDTTTAWINLHKERNVTLPDLKPGTYTLQVMATNAEGIWSKHVRQLTIVVTPKYYETMTAKVIVLMLILIAVAAIVYTVVYIRHLKARQNATLEEYLALLADSGKKDEEPVATEPTASNALSEEDEAFLQRVINFVDENIGNPELTVVDMAHAAAVSRSGLQRKIKQLMGVTPLDFLREARITRATTLLRESQKNISEIAYECGFSDPKYFSKCFKASKGKSPTEFRGSREQA